MKDYFELQLIMTNRKINEAGLHPVLGYFLGLITFILFAEYIFHEIESAKHVIILICLSFQFRLSEENRTDFLLITYGNKTKNKIRVLENLILCIPFASLLAYKYLFFYAISLFLCSIAFALISFQINVNFTIPTPFSKNPFEFSTGFRKTFLIFPLAYALTVIAISVDNLNLGIFSLLLIFLIILSFYSKPEEEYYVWVHADTPQLFLKKKMIIATRNFILILIPIVLGLLLYFPVEYDILLLFLLIGILFLWIMILAKYSVFPKEINIPEIIIITFAVSFPLLILFVIPYFYIKSIKNLRVFLHD